MVLRVYIKEILLVLLFAAAQSLIFHFHQLSPLAFVSLVPLFFLLLLCSGPRDAFVFGWIAGTVQSACTIYWLLYVTRIGFVLVSIGLGVFTAVFALVAYHSIQVLGRAGTEGFGWGWIKIVTLASLWVLIEFVRSNVPVLPWPGGLLGLSQWKNLPFIQSAEFWGVYGVSFVLALFAAGTFGVWMLAVRFSRGEISLTRYAVQIAGLAGLPILLVIANLGFGAHAIADVRKSVTESTPFSRIAVIQGNIPQDEKWDTRIQDMIFRKYDGLSRHVIMDSPDLVVWPETSFPGWWETEPVLAQRTQQLARDLSTEMLIGTPSYREAETGVQKINSVIHLSKKGKEIRRYSKIRLVPFGEYLPFFEFVRRFVHIPDFFPGTEYTLFRTPVRWNDGVTPDGKTRAFSALICVEDVYPDFSRRFVRLGSTMLINVTNDAWFMDSSAPYQHAQSSVFRAVENRVPVIRAANTGLSCYIDASGRVVDSVKDGGKEIMVAGFKIFDVALIHRPTLYTAYGDWFVVVLLVLFLFTHGLHAGSLNSTPVDDLD